MGQKEDVEDTLPRNVVAAARPRRRRSRMWLIAGGAVLAASVASGCFALALPHSEGPALPSAASTSHDVPLTGWGSTATWSTTGANGHVAVTTDGSTVAWASGKSVTIADAKTGKARTTAHLPSASLGGVFPVTVSGRPGVVAYTADAVSAWFGGHSTKVTARVPKGGRLEVRTGTAFIVAGEQVSMLTADGAVPLTSPRPGAAVLGTTRDGKVLWASSRGAVLTAATNGTVTNIATLAAPSRGAKITAWVTASSSTVWVRWKGADEHARLVAHSVSSGASAASTLANADGAAGTSQNGQQLLVDGVVFTASGHPVKVPSGFIASRFIGEAVYGAARDGDAAVLEGGESRSSALPTVVPVAVTANRDLVTVTDGRIAIYPRTQK